GRRRPERPPVLRLGGAAPEGQNRRVRHRPRRGLFRGIRARKCVQSARSPRGRAQHAPHRRDLLQGVRQGALRGDAPRASSRRDPLDQGDARDVVCEHVMVADEDIELGISERARLVSRYGRTFAAGEVIFREDEAGTDAFLLQEGRVRLLKTIRNAERSLIVLKPGDLFGESALLDAATRSSTAVALTDGVALALDRQTFRSLLTNYPPIAVRVMEQLVRRVRDAEDQIEILML